ncbi:NAD-dependent epimerase/dehydratase family protein [Jiella pacifica]|uniref:NAD-dependent epimerase/dehydratase family protein n=1 Tax=Jiella pacifica TaxID=2696469 RepID=A0A6N9T9Q6_9HYPH|nr:NAD(P)-dependent oxidoreductase [Jiella pacifica]NDW06429.1 NAD-dependent epimerase/dehydratase family protein [Jiella pacifica]
MKVLVFGAGGFVGRRLVEVLTEAEIAVVGADVAAARDPVSPSLHAIDVGDREAVASLVAETRPNVIVNLAYVTGDAIEADLDRSTRINVNGHLHVLDAARSSGVGRVVYSSSIAAYGPDQSGYGDRAITEADSCPLEEHGTTYGAMKAFNDFIALRIRAEGAVETCGVRLSIVFGPGRRHGFTAWTSHMLDPAREDAIEAPLAPDDPLSLISAGDAARLLALAVRSPATLPPVLNSGGYRVAARVLADEIAKLNPRARFTFSDSPVPPLFVDHVSGALAEKALGFRLQPLSAALRAEMAKHPL